jgi:hypothetical protein
MPAARLRIVPGGCLLAAIWCSMCCPWRCTWAACAGRPAVASSRCPGNASACRPSCLLSHPPVLPEKLNQLRPVNPRLREAAYMDIGRPRHLAVDFHLGLLWCPLLPHIRQRPGALHRRYSGPLTILHELVWIRRAEPVGCASKHHQRRREGGAPSNARNNQEMQRRSTSARGCGMGV